MGWPGTHAPPMSMTRLPAVLQNAVEAFGEGAEPVAVTAGIFVAIAFLAYKPEGWRGHDEIDAVLLSLAEEVTAAVTPKDLPVIGLQEGAQELGGKVAGFALLRALALTFIFDEADMPEAGYTRSRSCSPARRQPP